MRYLRFLLGFFLFDLLLFTLVDNSFIGTQRRQNLRFCKMMLTYGLLHSSSCTISISIIPNALTAGKTSIRAAITIKARAGMLMGL